MNEKTMFTKLNKKIVISTLALLSVIGSVFKIFVGFDIDEAFIIVQGCRLYQGEVLFADMWEIYQTSAIFLTPLISFWGRVHGNMEYLVLFLRIAATVVHLGISILLYCNLRKRGDKCLAFLLTCMYFNFLPRWTMNFEYGNLLIWFLTLHYIFLDDCVRKKVSQQSGWKLYGVFAGLFFAGAVLAYPTALLIYVVYIAALPIICKYFKNSAAVLKMFLWFSIGCLIAALVFFAYVLKGITLTELYHVLPYIFSDSSHSYGSKIFNYIRELPAILVRAAAIGLPAGACSFLLEKMSGKIVGKRMVYRWLCLWNVFYVLFIWVCNLLGRKSGPFGLQTRYLVLFLSNIFFLRCLSEKDKRRNCFVWYTAFLAYVSVLCASNMALEVNASFLILGILASMDALYLAGRKIEGMALTAFLTLVVLAAGSIYTKGFLVRVTGTGPATLMEKRVAMSEGPLKGIFIYEEDRNDYLEKAEAIGENTSVDDRLLYLSWDALGNLYTPGKFTSVTCHGSTHYDQQWVDYYEKFAHPLPTVIAGDMEKTGTPEQFMANMPFGVWMKKYYDVEQATEAGGVWFVRRLK